MAQGTPDGYQSWDALIWDFAKFAHRVCGQQSVVTALMFHIERQRDKESDRHSQSQAVEGILASNGRYWIRGESGLSAAQWKRANAELVKMGFLVVTPHLGAITEYRINSLAFSAAVEEKKRVVRVAHGELPQKIIEVSPEKNGLGVAHGEPGGVAHSEPRGVAHSELPQVDRMRVAHSEPHISQNQSLEEASYAREELKLVVMDATGATFISDALADRLYSAAVNSGLFMEMAHQYIRDHCREKKLAGDPIGPPVVAQALEKKRFRVSWLNRTENQNMLERCLRKQEEREYLESLKTKEASA